MTTLANVTLTIIKADGLVALNPGGTSNPFVATTIGSQSVNTPVVNKTTNPVFDGCTFQFKSCALPTVITFRVLNRLPFVDVEDLLGTATVTLFDTTNESGDSAVTPVTKAVTLSHGGNAALAQRAGEKGCGTLHISYTVEPSAVSPVAANAPAQGFPNNNATATTPRPEPVPIFSPPAHNISGPSAAMPPTAPASSSSSSSSTSATPHTSNLRSTNPSAENPAARSPKIGGVSTAPALLPATLTPPSIGPARAPVSLGCLVASSAAAAPVADLPVPVNNSGMPGYVSYPVPGVRAQPEVHAATDAPDAAAAAAPRYTPACTETYFANNNASSVGSATATPLGEVQPPTFNTLVLPVAASTPQAEYYTPSSLHDRNAVARSSSTAVSHTPSSSLYTNAAAAPVAQSQPLLVVPPNIEGTLHLTSTSPTNNSGAAGSCPVSAKQLPCAASPAPYFPTSSTEAAAALAARNPTTAASGSVSNSNSRVVSASAAVVAVAPRPAPWSRSNSRPSTPGSTSLSSSIQGAARQQYSQPQQLPRGLPRPVSTAGTGGAAPPQTDSQGGYVATLGAALPRPRSGEDLTTGSDGAARAMPKNRREPAPAARPSSTSAPSVENGDAVEAARLYADPQYLLSSAATGSDLAIFTHLKNVDPFLAHGFLACRDYAGRTLLHVAAWNGKVEVLRILLSRSPTASSSESVESQKDRMLAGSLLTNLRSTQGGNSILHAAAAGGQRSVVVYLQQSHNRAFLALKDARNDRQLTPAEAAKEAGFEEVAAMLL